MLGIISAEKIHMFLSIWKLHAKVNRAKLSFNVP